MRHLIRWYKTIRTGLLPLRPLRRRHLLQDPYLQFTRWYAEAENTGLLFPESMDLATCGKDGQPTVRAVLMKGHSPEGIEFYTNEGSDKARQLAENPKCSLLFHWVALHRQVRICGEVQRLSDEAIDRYFSTRPRGSQLGAWSSRQSGPLANRAELEAQVRFYEEKFSGGPVPRPPYWTGYRVKPSRWEFWQGQASRLHDRFVYTPNEGAWTITRLNP